MSYIYYIYGVLTIPLDLIATYIIFQCPTPYINRDCFTKLAHTFQLLYFGKSVLIRKAFLTSHIRAGRQKLTHLLTGGSQGTIIKSMEIIHMKFSFRNNKQIFFPPEVKTETV